MIYFNLTALTRATPFIQRKAKTSNIFPMKTFQHFTQFFIHSFNFQPNQSFSSNLFSSTTALRHFKRRAMAEMNPHFIIDEDQEMETQPIYLSNDESEFASPCSSPIPQLPNNVPDTYSAITQLTAAQHEQMSVSGTFALQYPTTRPTPLISDDENDEILTPITGNPAQFLPFTRIATLSPSNYANKQYPSQIRPNRQLQKIVGNQTSSVPMIFPADRHQLSPATPPPQYHDSSWRVAKFDIASPSATQRLGNGVFGLRKILWPSHRRNCRRLSQSVSTARGDSTRTPKQKNAFIDGNQSEVFTFLPPGVS